MQLIQILCFLCCYSLSDSIGILLFSSALLNSFINVSLCLRLLWNRDSFKIEFLNTLLVRVNSLNSLLAFSMRLRCSMLKF